MRLRGAAPVTLRAGEMAYIPPGTEHELKNVSEDRAVYLFVFSKAPSAEASHAH